MWAAGARHGWALPTLAYKLNRHTQSDYLDCHIYLEKGDIHHSSAAGSTHPTLIPSVRGGEVKFVPKLHQVMFTQSLVRHGFKTYLPQISQEENAGFAFGEPTKASRQGKDLC